MKTAFIHGYVLNGLLNEQGKMIPVQKTVVVENDRIVEISDQKEFGSDVKVIDLKGQYLLPGLINLHVHLAASGKPPKSEKKINYKQLFDSLAKYKIVLDVFLALERGYAKQELYSGVTTFRAVGGILDLDGKLRDEINAGKTIGPRILSANTAISVPTGHFAGSLATESTSPEEAVRDLEKISATHPDLIKLMITGGVMDASAEGEPGALKMSPEIVKAACDKAHELGYQVAAHVESSEGVRVALENGVDTIEHGARLDDSLIALFKEKKAIHVCTLSPALPYAKFDLAVSKAGEMGKRNGTYVFEGIQQCANTCLKEGIPVGLGTDTGCPFITHYDMYREIHYFIQYCGVSPDFALHTATFINACILKMDDQIGTIEKGKVADLIVCKENPLENIRTLSSLSYVMARGKLFDKIKIKKSPEIEKELDKVW